MSAFTDSLNSLLEERTKIERILALRSASPDRKSELLWEYGCRTCQDLAYQFFHFNDLQIIEMLRGVESELVAFLDMHVSVEDLF